MSAVTPSQPSRDAVSESARFLGLLVLICSFVWAHYNLPKSLSTLTPQWLLVGVAAPAYLAAFPWIENRFQGKAWLETVLRVVDAVLIGVLAASAAFLLVDGHRWFVFLVAAAELMLVGYLRRGGLHETRLRIVAGATILLSWLYVAGFSFTQLDDLFFNMAPVSELFVPAFCAALVLVAWNAIAPSRAGVGKLTALRLAGYAAALGIFLELSLRTDGVLGDWVLYHQSFFVGQADLLREGHWLLWDVPDQYGFLSIAAIAAAPFTTAWESLFVVSAVLSSLSALMLMVILRYGRTGVANFVFSLLLPAAIFCGSQGQRWPFGARFYPQEGIRFFWVIALLFVIFCEYAEREKPSRARLIRVGGHAACVVGSLWSFESAIWCTLIWGSYLAISSIVGIAPQNRSIGSIASALVKSLAPPLILWTIAFACVELLYAVRLHHLPDWHAFVEFSALYASDADFFAPVHIFRAGWTILLILGVQGLGVAWILRRPGTGIAVAAALWIATWSASIYYAGEAYDNHVAAIVSVAAFAWGILMVVLNRERAPSMTRLVAGLGLASLWVLLIASFLGEPALYLNARLPFSPGYHLDVAQEYPPVSGELLALMQRAGIRPGDRVVLPSPNAWDQIGRGMIMPFVNDGGWNEELKPWFLLSPVGVSNTLLTLPTARRAVYIDRFVRNLHQGGWYVTYHHAALCSDLAQAFYPTQRMRSNNFEVVYCALRPQ